jgi:hypothetical protein
MNMNYYERLINQKNRMDSIELQSVIRDTVVKLNSQSTSPNKPGILLGKIQSGKTRGFIGIIAEAFSNDYDVAIVLTKNSTLLGWQTTNRLEKEFQEFIETGEFADIHYVNTIHASGDTFTRVQLMQKHIFVGIKNYLNIDKLSELFFTRIPELKNKKVLIIDDEADYGSIGFRKVKGQDAEMIQTAEKFSDFRGSLSNYSFLQVTATPYSLYLQPEDYISSGFDYQPLKPAFTQILPTHSGYVGGDFYFEEDGNDQSPAYHLHITCRPLEIETLSVDKADPGVLSNVHFTPKLEVFRKSILYFMAGVALRRAQYVIDKNLDKNKIHIYMMPKYAFVYHIQTSKDPMSWQKTLIESYIQYLIDLFGNDKTSFDNLFNDIIEDLLESTNKGAKLWNVLVPKIEDIKHQLQLIVSNGDYKVLLINSDEKVIDRTDKNGQLKLESGMTFFVGGQVLDRGITIDNLIGFFYGRSPQTSKMDTVLQHARMYGNRKKEDLCVTRFYTTQSIYKNMKEIHFLDVALREQLQKNDQGIVSIKRSSDGRIIPCDPSRIALSNIVTIKNYKRILPYGFNVRNSNQLTPIISDIDQILQSAPGYTTQIGKTFQINYSQFVDIMKKIDNSFSGFDSSELKWDLKLIYDLTKRFIDNAGVDYINVYVRTNMKMGRLKQNGDYITVPETSSTDGKYAKIAATEIPCLILLRQEGQAANPQWNSGPFYWPVLYCPGNLSHPLIFSWDN